MARLKPQSEQLEKLPLEIPPVKVVRFSRKFIAISTVIFTAIITFALVAGLSPKKTAQGEEAKPGKGEVKSDNLPGLPDPLLSAPGTYPEAGRKQASGSAGTPRGKVAEPDAVAEPDTSQPVPPAYTVIPPGEGAESQVHKDNRTAINSPVTFEHGESTQQGRSEEPRAIVIPALPGLPQPGERPPAVDDQNMQGEKREFSRERQQDLPYIKATLLSPISQFEIKAGTILPATLITGINSDLPGQIVAQLRENVYDTVTGNHLLVPQGTRLIGEYDSKVAFGQERVLVVWTRLIMPNGDSINLEGMPGTDLSGYAGMTGRVNNHYGKLITGVVLGSVVGAGAQVAVGGQGAPNVPPAFGNLAVSGAAQNINQSAQQHTNKVLNMQPSIEVTPGDKINVFVTKDMILKPFTE